MKGRGGVRWRGLAEFRQALRNLPEALRTEADHIVKGATNAAAFDIRGRYGAHRRSGRLQASVSVAPRKARRFGVRWQVRASAWYARLFEYGHPTRQTKSGSPNPQPPRPTFMPAYRAHRARMYDALKTMLQRHGLLVRGDAG
jgi:hypothetical protein